MINIRALSSQAAQTPWDYVVTVAANVIEEVVLEILQHPVHSTFYNPEHSDRLHDYLSVAVCEAFERAEEGFVWAIPISWWEEREVVDLIDSSVTLALAEWDRRMTELLQTIINPTFWSACCIRLDGHDPPTQVYLDYRREVLCILGRPLELTTDQQRATAEVVCSRHLDMYMTIEQYRTLHLT
jgi:hypothetical protein